MSNFFTKHFGAIALGTAINLPALVKGAIWATDWLSRFDFWNTHGRDIPGINAVIGFMTDPPPWTVFFTSIAAVLIVLWDVRRLAKTPETATALDPVRKWKFGFFAFCATILTTVWALAWPLYFPALAKTTAEPPKIVEPLKPPPPDAAPPWVTTEEAETQRKQGRTLIVFSPQEFAALSGRGQNLKAYETKWVKVDYPVANLPVIETIEKKDYYLVYVTIEVSPYITSYRYLAAYFDQKRWGDLPLNLRMSSKLRAVCQFSGFERRVVNNYYTDAMIGHNCDLL
jgi:hypothetical protein